MQFFSKPRLDTDAKLEALNCSQALIEFETDGTIITANDNFLAALGYSLEEVQGQHHRMFVDSEEVNSPAYMQFWNDLGKGEFQSDEYCRIGKGGKQVWIQATYNPILDQSGVAIKVIKFATDITKAVNERLHRAEIQRTIDDDLSKIQTSIIGTSSQATQAAAASSQTSGNVQAVAGGLDELAASVAEINQISSMISAAVEEQSAVTSDMSSNMQIASRSVDDITGAINEIAQATEHVNSATQQVKENSAALA